MDRKLRMGYNGLDEASQVVEHTATKKEIEETTKQIKAADKKSKETNQEVEIT